MKCPKCGYLGFETTDRCRNCQYDFSLAPFSSEPELTLHGADRNIDSPADFDLPAIARPSDRLSASALDLDRLFGDPESQTAPPPAPMPVRKLEPPTITILDDDQEEMAVAAAESSPVMAMSMEIEPAEAVVDPPPVVPLSIDDGALPFEDGPIVPPPAARPPLAVRRSTPEVPRNRPRTTRPVKVDALDFESPERSSAASQAASDTVASLMELPSLGARVSAGAIDLVLLVGIDAAVVYLTLRVTGLQNSLEDLRVLPPVPFIGFLVTLAFGYVAAFTVAGGQTIGKMVLSLRVIGDDGRPVDAAGGMLRALGCMLVPITLGLSYLPALFTSDHRAIHDRLAGTRVVQE
ncbi:MAG: RDD family protein [Cyanobacteria bacterium]|nr:RDD family protein [Cyanobacteriota bacterium]